MQRHTICCSHGSTSLPSLVHYFKCKKVKNHFERKKARFLLCWYKHEVSLEPHGHASQFVQVFGTAFLKSGGQSVFLSTSDHLNIVLNTETAINNQKKEHILIKKETHRMFSYFSHGKFSWTFTHICCSTNGKHVPTTGN